MRDLPKALENWRQMMVHCIRQAHADECKSKQ